MQKTFIKTIKNVYNSSKIYLKYISITILLCLGPILLVLEFNLNAELLKQHWYTYPLMLNNNFESSLYIPYESIWECNYVQFRKIFNTVLLKTALWDLLYSKEFALATNSKILTVFEITLLNKLLIFSFWLEMIVVQSCFICFILINKKHFLIKELLLLSKWNIYIYIQIIIIILIILDFYGFYGIINFFTIINKIKNSIDPTLIYTPLLVNIIVKYFYYNYIFYTSIFFIRKVLLYSQ